MSNYGYQVLGGSLENAINGQLFYSLLPAIGESGSATHVQFGGRNFNDATREIIVFIADDLGNVLGQSAATLDAGSTGFAFYQIPLISPVALVSGKQYHVGVQTEGAGGTQILFDAGQAGFTYFTESATWPTIPSTITPVSGTASKALSLYIEYTATAGPTITGPNSTTEGSATVQTGTLQNTITTQSLISGSYSIEQTIDSATATTLNYVAESGVNQCVPATPVSGVPLEVTIPAAGVTPWVVQQEADDGVNPPATRNIALNSEATHDVIQAMIATSNTTVGESIFASTIIAVENDMQAYVPKTADGVNITWSADGTFTTDADQTKLITVSFFSPSTGQWSCIDLTIKNSSIVSFSHRDEWIRNQLSKDGHTDDLWREYWLSLAIPDLAFHDMASAYLRSLGYLHDTGSMWFSWSEVELRGIGSHPLAIGSFSNGFSNGFQITL